MGISSLGGRLGNMLSPFASLVVSKRARVFLTVAHEWGMKTVNHNMMIQLTGGGLAYFVDTLVYVIRRLIGVFAIVFTCLVVNLLVWLTHRLFYHIHFTSEIAIDIKSIKLLTPYFQSPLVTYLHIPYILHSDISHEVVHHTDLNTCLICFSIGYSIQHVLGFSWYVLAYI